VSRRNVTNLKEHELTLVGANKAQAAANKTVTPKKSSMLNLTSDLGDSKAMLMKMITDSFNKHVTKTITKNTVYNNNRKDAGEAKATTKTDKKPHTRSRPSMEVREEGGHHWEEGRFCFEQVWLLVSASQERRSVARHVLQDATQLQCQEMDGSR
jgi:hypothetical protein